MKRAKHPLAIVAAAVVVLLGLRALVALRGAADMTPEDQRRFSAYLWALTGADVVIGIAAGAVVALLARRAAAAERDRRRLEHLAEVALLSGGLAHEIRNHLNAQEGHLALLRKAAGPEKAEVRLRLGRLEQAAAALTELVNDFLTLTRPAKDKLERVDLAELSAEVVEFLSLDFEQAHVEVRLEPDAAVPPVRGDRGKLRRAILNLLVNARQAMPNGGSIVVRIRPGGRRAVQLEVEDNGCGIAPKDQPRVFEAFFSTKSGGAGLGLAVVQRTVVDMGGAIDFQSQAGRGSTFRIVLPAAR